MTPIEKDLTIGAPIDAVWAALTDPASIGAWMDDDSVAIDLRPGGSYAVFGGETTGTFQLVQAPNRLDYSWRMAGWQPEWPDSLVRWTLSDAGNGTRVQLIHDAFPNDDERNGHDDGWNLYWLDPMRAWLEEE